MFSNKLRSSEFNFSTGYRLDSSQIHFSVLAAEFFCAERQTPIDRFALFFFLQKYELNLFFIEVIVYYFYHCFQGKIVLHVYYMYSITKYLKIVLGPIVNR